MTEASANILKNLSLAKEAESSTGLITVGLDLWAREMARKLYENDVLNFGSNTRQVK